MMKWNKYPENKPQKSGKYIVTTASEICGTSYRWVHYEMPWSSLYEAWNATDKDYNPDYALTNIVAWAEMPDIAPYMGCDNGIPVERGC